VIRPRVSALDIVTLDASRAFRSWLSPRKNLIAEIALRGTYLDADDVNRLLALSLPGIDEVAALLEIVRLAAAQYERVVVDTAPTGHTLRLLAMPSLYARLADALDALQSHHRGVVSALTGRYEPDAADRLIESLAQDADGLMTRLRDGSRTEFVWVTLPEPMALEETSDALRTLRTIGITVRTLVVNRTAPSGGCQWDDGRRRFETRALSPLIGRFRDVDVRKVPECSTEPRSAAALVRVAASCARMSPPVRPAALPHRLYSEFPLPRKTTPVEDSLFDARWLLFGGKGGVGKTTCSAAAAVACARAWPERRFLLLSTDPAHSLGDVMGARVGDEAGPAADAPSNLDVREIDAGAGFTRFRERYLHTVDAMFEGFARPSMDAGEGRQAFRQLIDLAPPGIDEVMAISDVADLLGETGPYRTIFTDTAPTGHALRLLETPAVLREWTQALMAILLKYQEIVRSGTFGQLLVELSKRLRLLEALLRDASRTAFIIVTRAAALPREETIQLRASLERLGVGVRGVIVNAAGAGSCSRCRALVRRQSRELTALERGLAGSAPYAIIVTPSTLPPPHGDAALRAWRARWRRLAS
jgi:arsenite/tail-anchored protein-transporting ATPase